MNPETCPCARRERRDDGTTVCADCKREYPDIGSNHNDALKAARALLGVVGTKHPVSSSRKRLRAVSEDVDTEQQDTTEDQ